jgi:trimeric autotransporter adhesin
LSNIGNTAITLGSPLFAPVPTSTGFSVAAGTGSLACSSGNFYSGFSCNLNATFAPTTVGAATYPLVISAPEQNAPTPTVNLVGNGVNEGSVTVDLTQTTPTGTITYGEPITIAANVAPTTGSTAPTGYVVFTFDGQAQTPIAVTTASGTTTASAVLKLPAQNAGAHSVSAFYQGDDNYAAMSSAVLPINITLATAANTLTIVGDSADPVSSAPTHSLVMTDTLVPSVPGLFSGTVTFTNALTPNAPPLAVVPVGSPSTTGAYTVTFTYADQTNGLKAGNYNIVATYSGNTNYSGSASTPIPAVVTNPSFSLSLSSSTITSSNTNPGSINVTVTDYSNFQGGVVLNCTGLPANAYCVFRPISVALSPAVSVTPNTIYPVSSVLQIQVGQSLAVEEGSFNWIALPLSLIFLAAWRWSVPTRKLRLLSLLPLICLCGLAALIGCGSGTTTGPSTPSGSYPIVLTATATALTADGTAPSCSGSAPGCVPDLEQQAKITLLVK